MTEPHVARIPEACPASNTDMPFSIGAAEVRPDWATLARHGSVTEAEAVAEALGSAPTWAETTPPRWFQAAEVGEHGVRIASEPYGQAEGTSLVILTLPGDWWSARGERSVEAVRALAEAGWRPTRLDVQVTVPEGIGRTPLEIWQARERGELVSASRRARVEGSTNGDEAVGWTVSLGSRRSARFLRVYDKTVESGGEVRGVRWEIEFKQWVAEALWYRLAAAGAEGWGPLYSGELGSMLDFRVASSDPNVSRRERQQWWVDFLGTVETAVVAVAREPPTLEESFDYVRRLRGFLAMLVKAEGGDVSWLENIITEGQSAMGPRHWERLARAGVE